MDIISETTNLAPFTALSEWENLEFLWPGCAAIAPAAAPNSRTKV